MFWSGDTLASKLEHLVRRDDNKPVSKDQIDCASITLTIGSEVYITPNSKEANENIENKKRILDSDDPQFVIPRGQFAFLLTEEIIKVPPDAIAFISFKAKHKFKGLINVSGFHVDPGWDGKLVFSVYNAGPQNINLEKGDYFALIWFADLDWSSGEFIKTGVNETKITSDLLSNINGEVFSPFTLKQEIEDIDSTLKQEIKDIDSTLKQEIKDIKSEFDKFKGYFFTTIVGIALTIIIKTFFFNGSEMSLREGQEQTSKKPALSKELNPVQEYFETKQAKKIKSGFIKEPEDS